MRPTGRQSFLNHRKSVCLILYSGIVISRLTHAICNYERRQSATVNAYASTSQPYPIKLLEVVTESVNCCSLPTVADLEIVLQAELTLLM